MNEFIYQKLVKALSQQIEDAVWQPGDKIPSIRALASQFDVAKVSVQHALHRLEAAGLVQAKPRSGYYVTAKAVGYKQQPTSLIPNKPQIAKVPDVFHSIMARGAAFDILPAARDKSEHNQHIALLNRHIGRASRIHADRHASYYGDPAGDSELRQQLRQHYQQHGVYLAQEEICITSGCQHSLFLALMSCCEPGDTVAIESPAFYGVLQILISLKLKVVEIPASVTQGIELDELETAFKKWPIKACVVSPNFATPTGACMPLQNKHRLLALAEKHQVVLIEDDIYTELGFHLRPECLKQFDKSGNVIHCSSLSKSLSRDLRTGWISGGKFHDKIVHLKLVNQLANSLSLQQGVASFIGEGHFKRYLLQQRRRLLKQRDNWVTAINHYWPDEIRYTLPDGGLSFWVEFPKQVDTLTLYQNMLKHDIVLTPGMLFSTQSHYSNCLRLSFAHPLTSAREKALQKIARQLSRCK
ncbi:PLP-dependent aminotransferase family protein [Neptunicella marina]|uniref:PLP-dependent aminotransferase family protein n=1 Tax=Neptunicella marina TaxID=2125989 RepID=A0A8J6IXX6_9ALTE|nr:PLP-dependent aminotransferase family protein [Neptunicella marina]MBC3767445.1 PLP-dependent aminotransferase family protein [Neptunicella marina]